MATLKTIAAALKLVDTKKESLKKAFDDLQAHSSLLSSFSLSWSDLDSHFSSVQNSLTERFRLLESLESTQSHSPPQGPPLSSGPSNPPPNQPQLETVPKFEPARTELASSSTQSPPKVQDPSSSSNPPRSENRVELVPDPVVTQSLAVVPRQGDPCSSSNPPGGDNVDGMAARMRTLCKKMNGKGLRRYLYGSNGEQTRTRAELLDAIRAAPDPGTMVLDAMEGFYGANGDSKHVNPALRRTCILLLEHLLEANLNMPNEVREKAKQLALEWKEKASTDGGNSMEALAFLNLVAAYQLQSEFDIGELVEYFVVIARYRQATSLCRTVGVGDKVVDLIQKLVKNGKQLLAVKFIFEFNLTEKFPVVPLLKAYINATKKHAKKVRKSGKASPQSLNDAITKEVNALKAAIKVIEEHKLDSEFPRINLESRIKNLEILKINKKRAATAPPSKPQQQQQQTKNQLQNGNKRPRTSAAGGPTAVSMSAAAANTTVPPFQQTHIQPAGLLPDHSAAYLSAPAPAGPYGFIGSTPPIAPYVGSSSGLYGLAGGPMGIPANPNPAGPHLYSSESHIPSGYYDMTTPYGGYALPPTYHPSYYPQ